MQIILLERVAKLGQMGEVVDVKPGYARNFLLPKGKALVQARGVGSADEAEQIATALQGLEFTIHRAASETGAIYGSVSARDIANAVDESGYSLDHRRISVEKPIKALGSHNVTVNLQHDVEASFVVRIAKPLDDSARAEQEPAATQPRDADFDRPNDLGPQENLEKTEEKTSAEALLSAEFHAVRAYVDSVNERISRYIAGRA